MSDDESKMCDDIKRCPWQTFNWTKTCFDFFSYAVYQMGDFLSFHRMHGSVGKINNLHN